MQQAVVIKPAEMALGAKRIFTQRFGLKLWGRIKPKQESFKCGEFAYFCHRFIEEAWIRKITYFTKYNPGIPAFFEKRKNVIKFMIFDTGLLIRL